MDEEADGRRRPKGSAVKFSKRLPERFRQAKMTDLTELFGFVKEYASRISSALPKKGLILSGSPGVGKTYALAALTNFYYGLRIHRDHEFVTAPDLFDNYASPGDEPMMDYRRATTYNETYVSVPWLVINDLGKEYRGGKLAEQIPYKLGRLLRARGERQLVTHVTTNLAVSEGRATLRSVYGDSIMSLMNEQMDAYEVSGPDLRSV